MFYKGKGIFLLAFFILLAHITTAQKTSPTVTKKNTIKVAQRFLFKTPIPSKITYDKLLGKYVISKKIGDYHLEPPQFFPIKEYDKFLLKREIKDYYKSKLSAVGSFNTASGVAKKNLLPTYYVNNKFFSNVFGSNDITVSANANLDFRIGVIYQDIKNPNVSPDNQKNWVIDFNQKITANLNAKIGERLRISANYDTQASFDFQNIFKVSFIPKGFTPASFLKKEITNLDKKILQKTSEKALSAQVNKVTKKAGKKTGIQIPEKLLDLKTLKDPSQILANPNELLNLGNKDDFLQGLDVGNVSMDMSNRLIAGARNLFGVKTKMVFGNTTIKGVFSQQRSDRKTIVAEKGGTVKPFEFKVTDYDTDRHFFLAHYFRNRYNIALSSLPLVQSPVRITRIEVWLTNRNFNTNTARSIVALTDLGEKGVDYYDKKVKNISNGAIRENSRAKIFPDNSSNSLESILKSEALRKRNTIKNILTEPTYREAIDYIYLEKARKLKQNEYTFNAQLGILSLRQSLNSGDALAVAFEYTVVGDSKIYRVGELSTDGVKNDENLILKLLRSNVINPNHRIWDLMMKNVYRLNAYEVEKQDFRLEILHKNDQTGVAVRNLQDLPDVVNRKKTLLNLTGVDVLNQNNFPKKMGDGFFDYLENITIKPERGVIFFPSLEPFGRDLEKKIGRSHPAYIFNELYKATQFQAKNQFQIKDKYRIKGYYKSSMNNDISLGAFNVPRGSVKVTAGGVTLKEGLDYTVDYLSGSVKITNPSIQNSGVPVQVSLEEQNMFNQNFKRFIGFDLIHRFSDRFQVSATYLNLHERPVTQKVNLGQDPISNHMFGASFQYHTPVSFIDNLLRLANSNGHFTASKLSLRGDIAYLIPGTADVANLSGETTAYLDDFEDAQRPIEISGARPWKLASKPLNFKDKNGVSYDFGADASNDLAYGKKRAKLAWYNIDRIFYQKTSATPKNIDDEELSRNEVSAIRYSELFPKKELDITQLDLLNTLDLAYYPSERGSYNYDTDTDAKGRLNNPEKRWAGITRAIATNDFQRNNIEYIQFWMQDPYENYSIKEREGASKNTAVKEGTLFLNLGNISEDILRDDIKQFENGLPEAGELKNIIKSVWGDFPAKSKFIYTFDNSEENRRVQDVGLDGLSDTAEKSRFTALKNLADPSSDNYEFYRSTRHDKAKSTILQRYKNYNNTEGNTPIGSLNKENYPTAGSNQPDAEDINNDQTMNTINAYYQYQISLNESDLTLGKNNIVDTKTTTRETPLGAKKIKWYQFRIPIKSGMAIGGIHNFNAIRFMRFFLTRFKSPVVLRLAKIELVQGSWIRATKNIHEGTPENKDILDQTAQNNFKVGVVNIEENESRTPIPYVMPPGIRREQMRGSGTSIQQQNEQALSLRVKDLPSGETRGVYKNVSQDLRMYEKLKIFVHSETSAGDNLKDGDLVAVLRMGSDLDAHYYQVELPLKNTQWGAKSAEEIWGNEFQINLKDLANLKLERHKVRSGKDSHLIFPAVKAGETPAYRMRVKGFPNLANIKTMLLGVKNADPAGVNHSGEVWFNEMRVAGFEKKGGWAAQVEANMNVADLANVALSGRYQTIGFGDINQRTDERSQDEIKQYGLITNINAGKLLPKKWGFNLPINYTLSEMVKNPKYDPLYQDLLYKDTKEFNDQWEAAQDYTRHKGIGLVNAHIAKSGKARIYDLSNFNFSYQFSESFHKNYSILEDLKQQLNTSLGYQFAFKPITLRPFKKIPFLNNPFFKIIGAFHVNLLPRNIQINANIRRSFNRYQSRSLVEDLPALPTLKQRIFLFDWDYAVSYPISRSLNVNFKVANHHIYDDFENDENLSEIRLFDNLLRIGRAQKYQHQLKANYTAPLNLLPYLDFLKASYAYTADFQWEGVAPHLLKKMGNTIGNANTHNITLGAQITRLYSRLKLKKLFGVSGNGNPFKPNHFLYHFFTMFKNVQVGYTENNSTQLEGYDPQVNFARDLIKKNLNPSLGFLFGEQTDIRGLALQNGWLTTRTINKNTGEDDPYINRGYAKNHYQKFSIQMIVKPLADFNISIKANRTKTNNVFQQLDAVVDGQKNERLFNPTVLTEAGNFAMSYNMVETFFKNPDQLFETFLQNRTKARELLGEKTRQDFKGFQPNGQQVLLAAFTNAYRGRNLNTDRLNWFEKIPGLNWSVNYAGLMRTKWFRSNFKTFSIRHAYTGTYTLGSFTNNPNHKINSNGKWAKDEKGFYHEPLQAQNLILSDGFKPLIGLNVGLKNNFSLKGMVNTNRALTLNFTNNTLSQITSETYTLGLGYRITDVNIWLKIGGRRKKFNGNINIRADIRYQKNLTMIREIETRGQQITAGQNLFSFKLKADYRLSNAITAFFYYDQLATKYAISTAFPRSTINTGVGFTYRLGNQ